MYIQIHNVPLSKIAKCLNSTGASIKCEDFEVVDIFVSEAEDEYYDPRRDIVLKLSCNIDEKKIEDLCSYLNHSVSRK